MRVLLAPPSITATRMRPLKRISALMRTGAAPAHAPFWSGWVGYARIFGISGTAHAERRQHTGRLWWREMEALRRATS